MPAYNAAEYISEAMESVLKQSFPNFEFIIIDDGSTDNTLSVIRSFDDKRIRVIENKHNFIGSLNMGIEAAKGKYIARMDADDIMHIDRLKIQQAIMEDEPDITVCGSWMSPFGENIPKGTISQTVSGVLDYPLLSFMQRNVIFHPTTMIRYAFLRNHSLQYEDYECAEDYKLWVEIARHGGMFYVEAQPLLYMRIPEQQLKSEKGEICQNSSYRIQKEILDHLIGLIDKIQNGVKKMEEAMWQIKNEGLINEQDIFSFFYMLFMKNKNSLATGLK